MLEPLNRRTVPNAAQPTLRVLQFGGGVFLRGFVDWMIERMNRRLGFDAGIVVMRADSRPQADPLAKQDGLYHVLLHGVCEGRPEHSLERVDCLREVLDPRRDWVRFLELAEDPAMRWVVSNTTEAGIVLDPEDDAGAPSPRTFPARLAAWLHHRYRRFGGDPEQGVVVLPCELIDDNGATLAACVAEHGRRAGFGAGFETWLRDAVVFCNTLVDRIVAGRPADPAPWWAALGYRDELLVEGEAFHLWVIEGPPELAERFPAARAGLNVHVTDDVAPYRERKVRILNGLHSATCPLALLEGVATVREAVLHPRLGAYMRRTAEQEIQPYVPLPAAEVAEFTAQVFERFANPAIEHRWSAIALNAVAKWRTRVWPSWLDAWRDRGAVPRGLTLSLAALLAVYRWHPEAVRDAPERSARLAVHWPDPLRPTAQGLAGLLADRRFWDEPLAAPPALAEALCADLERLATEGVAAVLDRWGAGLTPVTIRPDPFAAGSLAV
ncbi:MAG: altronate oxidoreductase [Gammaproteobacteria bacterium]|nr:MAG: altronate oxidoreductase [Gammaproteobacteria bacterium]